MKNESLECAVVVATLLGASEEFSVRECARTALSKGIVGLAIHTHTSVNLCDVPPALGHILAPFEQDGFEPKLNKSQGRKQSCGTAPHNNHRSLAVNIGVVEVDFGGHLLAIHKDFNGEKHLWSAMTCIHRAFDDSCKSHLLATYAESANYD